MLTGGSIGGRVTTFDDSALNVSGSAALARNLTATNHSTINLSGGTVARNLQGFGNGTINMSGGTVTGQAVFRDESVLNYSGGTIGMPGPGGVPYMPNLLAHDSAVLNIRGNNLVASLLNPVYQDGLFSVFQLSGTLADGISLNGTLLFLENGTGASLNLLPPVSLLGDYNRDSIVDAADHIVWRKSPSNFGGDPGGYNTWRTGFGQTFGGGAALYDGNSLPASVPEPTTVTLLIFAGGGTSIRRNRASLNNRKLVDA